MHRFFMFVFAFLFPPITAVMSGSVVQLCINIFLCLCFWIPGMIHAFILACVYQGGATAAEYRNPQF